MNIKDMALYIIKDPESEEKIKEGRIIEKTKEKN